MASGFLKKGVTYGERWYVQNYLLCRRRGMSMGFCIAWQKVKGKLRTLFPDFSKLFLYSFGSYFGSYIFKKYCFYVKIKWFDTIVNFIILIHSSKTTYFIHLLSKLLSDTFNCDKNISKSYQYVIYRVNHVIVFCSINTDNFLYIWAW